MNKIKLIFVFCMVFLFSNVNATWDTVREEVNIPEPSISDSVKGKYWVFFCNDKETPKKWLQIMTVPWQKNEVCLFFVNDSEEDIRIEVWIVDWTERPSGSWRARNITCKTFKKDNQIINFITSEIWYTSGWVIIDVPARTRFMKQLYITFPVWIEWSKLACMVYSLIGSEKSAGNMFNFKFRTTSYIDFFVGSKDFNLGNNISIKNLSISKDLNNKIVVEWFLFNDGAFNEKVSITWTINNIFWFNRTFSINDVEVKVWSSTKFSTESMVVDTYIPWYKWLFVARIEANYKPYFDFDISNMKIPQNVLDGGILTSSDYLFIMPWFILIWFVIFVLLVYKAFFKNKK